MRHEYIQLTRQALYDRVWSTPTAKLAEEFGISDVAIAKLCKKAGIPKPPPGYWQRLKAGQHIRKPPLPRLKGHQPDSVFVRKQTSKPMPPSSKELQALIEAEVRPESRVHVKERLHQPHPLVERTKTILEQGYTDRYGIVRRPDKKFGLDIRVTKASLPRALRLMDALIKAFETRGHRVELEPEHMRYTENTKFVVGEDDVRVTLREVIRQHETVLDDQQKALPYWQQPAKYTHSTNGTLLFLIDQYGVDRLKKRWVDGKVKLEDQLNAVIVGILTITDHKRMERLEREAQEQRRREKEHEAEQRRRKAEMHRLEAQRRQHEEVQRRNDLERMAEQWIKNRRLRLFIRTCERQLMSEQAVRNAETSIVMWLQWAYEHADRTNPLQNGELEQLVSRMEEARDSTFDDA